MKYEIGGKIMTKFVGLTTKPYSYLMDDGSQDRETKYTKMCTQKKHLIWKL